MECLVSSREHPYKDLNKVVEQIVNEYHAYEYRDVVLEVANKSSVALAPLWLKEKTFWGRILPLV